MSGFENTDVNIRISDSLRDRCLIGSEIRPMDFGIFPQYQRYQSQPNSAFILFITSKLYNAGTITSTEGTDPTKTLCVGNLVCELKTQCVMFVYFVCLSIA
jgi:hypothetical protein